MAESGTTAVIVLAAGRSERLPGDLPKVLQPLCGMPVLAHVLDGIEAVGVRPIVIVVGHGREQVEAAFADRGVHFAVQERQRGTADAVRVGLEGLVKTGAGPIEHVLVACGDAPLLRAETLHALLAAHGRGKSAATILTGELCDPTGYGRILRARNKAVRGIVEEKDASARERAVREVNSGTMVFRAEELQAVLPRIAPDNAQGELYLTDAVRLLVAEGHRVDAVRAEDPVEIAGINTRQELAEAIGEVRFRTLEDLMAAGVTVEAPDLTWVDRTVTVGVGTVIRPFTVITGRVTIGRGCEVGPFTHLREGTVLEDGAQVGNFVEVKKTVLGRGAKAKHLSYLGDGVVGAEANIGAGTIFANYDGRAKHRTVVKDRAFIGSGTVLVAPVTVGEGASTGAGAVVTRGRDVKDGETVIGVPARPLRERRPPPDEEAVLRALRTLLDSGADIAEAVRSFERMARETRARWQDGS